MTQDERIASLERKVAELSQRLALVEKPKDWRNLIGAFDDCEGMQSNFAEGQRIREEERQSARRTATS